ncbi:MAG: DUF2894 domain-containing protein [Stenotrophomonas sp.]
MRPERFDLQAQLLAWRKQGADRIDPLRFALIAALARRAAGHDGVVRQQLDARLLQLVDAYAHCVAAAPQAPAAAAASSSSRGPLRALLDHIGGIAPSPVASVDAVNVAAVNSAAGDPGGSDAAPPREPLAALDEFQQLWGRIRIDSLLRQSLESISEDAGPLHSSVLLHRAMTLMRDISPEYLQHFLAYADVLTWMEQLNVGATSSNDVGRSVSGRKTTRASGSRRKK